MHSQMAVQVPPGTLPLQGSSRRSVMATLGQCLMKVLVANLGSTSFKYRLFDLTNESQLAKGGIDRIGQKDAESSCSVQIGSYKAETK